MIEASRVENGYPMETNIGSLGEMQKWADEVLAKESGYVEMIDEETGETKGIRTKVTIRDETGKKVSEIIGEEEEVRRKMANIIHPEHEGWTGEYWTYGERGSKLIIRKCERGFVVAVISPTDVADWATRKYSEKALYMMAKTHEGTEVYGEELTKGAVEVLIGRGY